MMVTMMFIHGQSLGILLPVLTTIPSIIMASPSKVMIDLDISGLRPTMVRVAPSRAYPGGTNYTIRAGFEHTHILGTIRDGHDVLIDGDSTASIRCVTAVTGGNGGMYVRVLTRWNVSGNRYRTAIREFRRGPMDGHYRPIIRTPIEVDVLTQDITPYINVELLVDWKGHEIDVIIGRTNEGFPEDLETLPILFTIQPEVDMHAMIGVVRFGHYILENEVEGLLYREISWEGGVVRPIITILSDYANGLEVEKEYTFADGERGFILTRTKRKISPFSRHYPHSFRTSTHPF